MKSAYFEKPIYTLREIDNFPEFTDAQMRLAHKIYALDRGNRTACYASVEGLADLLGKTPDQVRGLLQRMRKFVFTVGYLANGIACRRLRLPDSYKLRADVRGSVFRREQEGVQVSVKRRVTDRNPAVFYVDEACGDTARLDVPQRRGEQGSETPIAPCKQGANDLLFTGKESSDTSSCAAEAAAPLPAQVHDADVAAPKPRSRGGRYDWVTHFHALPVAALLCQRFHQPNVSVSLAKKVVQRFRRGDCHAAGIRFVLSRLEDLPGEERNPARRPATLEEFITRFKSMMEWLQGNEATKHRCDLQADIESLGQTQPRPAAEFARFTRALERDKFTSFDDFLERGDATLAWAAAYYFRARGEDVLCNAQVSRIAVSMVKNPAVCDFLAKFFNTDCADLCMLSRDEVYRCREQLLSEMKECRRILSVAPTATRVAMFSGVEHGDHVTFMTTLFMHDPETGLTVAKEMMEAA